MKSKETKLSIEDFNAKQISETQIHSIKGGQGTFIVIEDAEGI